MTDRQLLSLSGVSLAYGRGARQTHALRDVTLQIAEGEVVALCGRNGSGKSSLVSVLLGLNQAQTGALRVWGQKIPLRGVSRALRVSYVAQTNSLDSRLTVQENLNVARVMGGLRHDEVAVRRDQLLMELGLADSDRRRVGQLSGGQQRKVDLVRALLCSPEFLILDEPSAGLDADSVRSLWSVLRQHLENPKDSLRAVLVVSHQSEELGYADRFLLLEDGQVARVLSRDQVMATPSLDSLEFRFSSEVSREAIESVFGAAHVKVEQNSRLVRVQGRGLISVLPQAVADLSRRGLVDSIEQLQLIQENLLDQLYRLGEGSEGQA